MQVTLPARVHVLVLVSKIHKPTLRALAYARASRPTVLEAITVDVDHEDTVRLQEEWEREGIPVTLKILASPYREITRPILDYVRELRRDNPQDLVTVFIPEYVVGHWWEQLLHNQSALRLKSRLLFTPGVMVTSVPWQLKSSELVDQDELTPCWRRQPRCPSATSASSRSAPSPTAATSSPTATVARCSCATRSRGRGCASASPT